MSKSARELHEAVRLMERPSDRVAYIRHRGRYSDSEFAAFHRLRQWARRRGLPDLRSTTFAVGWDSCITPDAQCRYDVRMPIPDEIENDNEIDVQVIPGGSFAVYRSHSNAAVVPLPGSVCRKDG